MQKYLATCVSNGRGQNYLKDNLFCIYRLVLKVKHHPPKDGALLLNN